MTLQLLAPHICSGGVGGKRWTLQVRYFDDWGGKTTHKLFIPHIVHSGVSLVLVRRGSCNCWGGGAAFRARTQNVNNGDMIGNTGWNRLLIEGFHPTWQQV